MKQSRRHELKTNELSIYLQQVYDFLVRNSTYVIGGVVVVTLIIVVGMMNLRSRHRAKVDAMNRIQAIQSGEGARDTKLLEEIEGIANDYSSEAGLGPEVLDLQASVAHQLALNYTGEADKPKRAGLLKEARSACEQAIRDFSDQAIVVARARMTLAGVEETLLIDGQGDDRQIRKLYQDVVDGPVSPYQKLASQQLGDLDKRLAKLVIVAAPPATPPADTAPAATTGPVGTRPVATTIIPALQPPTPTAATTKPATTAKPAATAKPTAPKPGTAAKPKAKPATKPAR